MGKNYFFFYNNTKDNFLEMFNGFVINGIDAYNLSGLSVSGTGDFNGDGFDDLIIGAFGADPNGNSYAGESYVVFGSDEPFDPELNLYSLDGTNGFVINGIDAGDESGHSVSSAGDINGDGFDDLIISANKAHPNGNSYAGESYVVFGSDEPFDPELNLYSLDGTNGFVINGIDAYDGSGHSVSSAGDINGDGFDDLIIGAPSADPNGNSDAGESYVVFGSDGAFDPELNLGSLDGTNGFVINGIDADDSSGWSVSSAGDFNGDGFDDLIISANNADPNGNDRAGESYVVFGSDGAFDPELNLSSLDGSNGFVLLGIDADDFSGWSVSSAGDFNGDGFDDLIIGAIGADPNGNDRAGESYVVFGSDGAFDPELNLSELDGTNGFVINGIDAGDDSGNSVSSAGDINGDGFDDLIIGATGADPNGNSSAGESYVIFGRACGTINHDPVANDDSFTTDEDSSLSGSVLTDNGNGADHDPDGDITTVTAVNGIAADVGSEVTLANGAILTLNADGSFDYNPNGQFDFLNNGETDTDSFTYSIDDGNGATATATVTVTINGVNDAPIGNPDSVSTSKNTALTIAVSDLLGNDTDVDNASIQITGVSNASNGSVILDDNGTATDKSDDSIIFEPQNGFTGVGSFDYTVSDGDLISTTTVTVDVEVEPGTEGSDSLIGGNGNDEIFGLAGSDFLDGGDGNDTLSGGDDDDFVLGGNGNDRLLGGDGDDFLFAGEGNDTLLGGIGNDFLQGDNGSDSLIGGDGDDFVLGGEGNDRLSGEDGDDVLLGGKGNDFLSGGVGSDVLIGGQGTDTFVLVAGEGTDTILDFNNDDDLIGLGNGLGFSDLTLSGSEIILTETQEILASLTGVNTETLTEANFVLM